MKSWISTRHTPQSSTDFMAERASMPVTASSPVISPTSTETNAAASQAQRLPSSGGRARLKTWTNNINTGKARPSRNHVCPLFIFIAPEEKDRGGDRPGQGDSVDSPGRPVQDYRFPR